MKIDDIKDEFKKQLRLRGYSFNTIEVYGSCAALFLSIFKDKKPVKSDIEDWLLSFKSDVYRKHLLCAIKALNKYIYTGNIDCDSIPYPRPTHRLPEILSPQEMQLIFNVCPNKKHRSVIALLYSAGLRISEVINLKWCDIDRSRMVINIRQGKNKKDRQVPLDENVLKLLEKYWSEFKSKVYVFNGQEGLQYSAKSVQEFLKKYALLAGIKKRIHPHQLRHSCMVELFNNGTDATIIQAICGHEKIATTMHYVHLSNKHISKVNSPINQIKL